jgi:hypothetical protein
MAFNLYWYVSEKRSVVVFEFEDGLIRKEREYYDDVLWLESGGKS